MAPLSEGQNVFLLQVSEPGSTNILEHNKYRNEDWRERSKDGAHGMVTIGDLLLVYFTGGAIDYQKQLKIVLKVLNVTEENREFQTEILQEINRALTLSEIREKVEQGVLTDVFLNCGRQGFNICQINPMDYEKVLMLSETLPPAPVVVRAENLLEEFIVDNWRPSQFFGQQCANLEIKKDDDGETIGQQYETRGVGIIDLLCQDKKSGEYTVIEIKKGNESSDQAVGQLARYMGWVKKNLAGDKQVSGIIIAGGHDEKTRCAISVIPNIHLANYEMSFKISLLKDLA